MARTARCSGVVPSADAGDWAAAEKGFTFITSPESRPGLSASTAYAHLALARVQVQLGKTSEARAGYRKFFDIFKDERAATAVEYGLILALIFLAMVGAVGTFANTTINMWENVSNSVQGS